MSNEMTAEIAALQAERDTLRKERDEALSRVAEVKADNARLAHATSSAIEDRVTAQKERDQLRKDCHRLGEWHRDVAGQLQDAQAERDTLAEKNKDLHDRLATQKLRANELEARVAELESSMRLATREIGKYAGQCGRLEVDLEMEKAKVAKLTVVLETIASGITEDYFIENLGEAREIAAAAIASQSAKAT